MKKTVKILIAVIVPLVLVILAATCFTTVPTGYTGIVTTLGKVEGYTFDAGFHIKGPFQKVIKILKVY